MGRTKAPRAPAVEDRSVSSSLEPDAVEVALAAHLARDEHPEAATLALRSYGPALLSYLFGVLRDRALAEEAFADFSEQLWRSISGFRGECSFRSWAYRLAWHTALRTLKDPYRRRGRRLETEELSALVEAIRTATPLHLQTDAKSAVDGLRQALEPEERALLILRLDRGLSWKEIAGVLAESQGTSVPEAALRKRFERIKSKLRVLAERAGLLAPK